MTERYENMDEILMRIAARVPISERLGRYLCAKTEAGEEDPDNGIAEPLQEKCLHVHIAEVNVSTVAAETSHRMEVCHAATCMYA